MQSAAKSQTQQKRLKEVKVKVTQSCLSDPMDYTGHGTRFAELLKEGSRPKLLEDASRLQEDQS